MADISPETQFKTWVEINKSNLLHNLNTFTARLDKKTTVMAVIKANAYGHGLREVAAILRARPRLIFGVDSYEEACAARAVSPKNEIMILGFIPPARRAEALQKGFHIAAYDRELVKSLNALFNKRRAWPERFKVHLKIETGTNRLGLTPAELNAIMPRFPVSGVYTHLADAENPKSQFYKTQTSELKKALAILKRAGTHPDFAHISCSNTAAIIRGKALGGNLVRLGIGLYGLWPSPELKREFENTIILKPVLSWKTRIAQAKRVARGATVGYDRTYRVARATRIGILPVGYYDGYARGLSNRGEVLINGARAKIAGMVCMNMTMIDLGNARAAPGKEIILIGKSGGEEISTDEIAERIGTINYEVAARINPLLPRIVR